MRKKLIFRMCYWTFDFHVVVTLHPGKREWKAQNKAIYFISPLNHHGSHHNSGPASAMVARETSNLEAAGSSPALGSSSDCFMGSTIFCFSFWDVSLLFAGVWDFPTSEACWKLFCTREYHLHSPGSLYLIIVAPS